MYAAVRSVINTRKLNGLSAFESIAAVIEQRSTIRPEHSSQYIPDQDEQLLLTFKAKK